MKSAHTSHEAATHIDALEHKRHTLAHLMAAAVLELWPDTKLTIGPAIANGFYYDFAFSHPITESDLPIIQKKMLSLLPSWEKFSKSEVDATEAKKRFAGNQFKTELIEEIVSRGEKLTLYTCGDFTDLCRGGHADDPAHDIAPDSFTLSHIAGAYWRGDEAQPMLTRIYGLAFDTKAELDAYIAQQEEAKKRDHKKLGKELGLFTISPLVGAGLPLMQPKGMVIRKAIEDYLWELHHDKGYDRVWTPHIAREELYVTSGHAAKFGDELFRVQGKEEKFFLKPMNCPHHMQLFADHAFSYRQLPVRYFEPATVYRDEKSGQLGGLTRVRAITQDDGHLFCRASQIGDEVGVIVGIIKQFYSTFGLMNDYWVSLSVRGDDRSKYLGSDDVWNTAESALEQAAKKYGLNYRRVEGEAAFYGPKLDFIFKDSIGREWQLATIQCDFNLPERFDLSFTNENNVKERPVVIHRAISGSLERFMGILIEHYAGVFPLWLSPVQVRVIPVKEQHAEKAEEVAKALRGGRGATGAGSSAVSLRAEADLGNDNLGKKVRRAKTEKVPYLIVVGNNEVASNTYTLEHTREEKKDANLTLEHLREQLTRLHSERK